MPGARHFRVPSANIFLFLEGYAEDILEDVDDSWPEDGVNPDKWDQSIYKLGQ